MIIPAAQLTVGLMHCCSMSVVTLELYSGAGTAAGEGDIYGAGVLCYAPCIHSEPCGAPVRVVTYFNMPGTRAVCIAAAVRAWLMLLSTCMHDVIVTNLECTGVLYDWSRFIACTGLFGLSRVVWHSALRSS